MTALSHTLLPPPQVPADAARCWLTLGAVTASCVVDPTQPSRLTARYNLTRAGAFPLVLRLGAATATEGTAQVTAATVGRVVTVVALPTPALHTSGLVGGGTALTLVAGEQRVVRAVLRDTFSNVVAASGFRLSVTVYEDEEEEGEAMLQVQPNLYISPRVRRIGLVRAC
jgi:hypothetical protein